MIYLHTLGDTLIKVGDKSIRPTSPLMFAALLYLGMERGRRVPRAALQELLFPKMDERSGAHSLRQLLYKLRQLQAPIQVEAGTVLVAAGDVRDEASSLDLRRGHQDRRLASGFLPDYNPRFSDRYTEWLDRQRALWAADIRKRLVAAIASSRETMDWSAVEDHGALLEAFDPYNEVAVFARAEAAAMAGGKTSALRILEQYEKDTGRADLKLPASLLRRRIAKLVKEPPRRFGTVPFTGREADVRELRHHITRTRNGHSCLYLVGGDPGIGKTRLLEEIAALAVLEGMKVFQVRCHSHYASRPLSVFLELAPLMRDSRGALGISPESAAFLDMLVSHSDSRTDQPSDARDNVVRSEQLLCAVRDLWDAVASEQAVMICVEDVHWADADSLRDLSRLVHSLNGRPLIVVCTTRTPDTFPRIPATDDGTVVRRLMPLDDRAMASLARHFVDEQDPQHEAFAAWLVNTAAGNPLFLQMLCAHYASTGEAFGVPADLRLAISTRVEALNTACRRVLELTALLGRHSTIETIRGINAWTHLQLLDAVRLLEEYGYVKETEGCLRAHPLIGECAVSLLPPVSRRILHACVARALEDQFHASTDASVLWDCAEQWTLSGDSEKGADYLRRCARHVWQLGRSSQALALLERAAGLGLGGTLRQEILRDTALIAKAAGRWDLAYNAALQVSPETLAVHDDTELACNEAEWFITGASATCTRRAMFCARASNADYRHRIAAARFVLTIAHEECDAQLAHTIYSEVEPLLASSPHFFDSSFFSLYFHCVFGSRLVGQELVENLTTQLDSVPLAERFRAATNAAVASTFVGAFDQALAILETFLVKARERDLPTWTHDIASVACAAQLSAGRVKEAREWYAIAAETSHYSRRGIRSSMEASNEAELAILDGCHERAVTALSRFDVLKLSAPRVHAYFAGLHTRASQLDENFVLDPSVRADLEHLHARTKAFACGDSLALALLEDMRRRGDELSFRALIEAYLVVRREGPPLLTSQLAAAMRVSLPSFSGRQSS